MPIDTIPILSEDYPLFDWDDYPLSYYALGEGELVSGFQKETWNAIIDKTLAALSAAGMSWDSTYTTSANAKVTAAYGALSAKMFNSVRHNIELAAPVGWGWAKNPNMRGYIGRNDFKGYADYGLNGDLFYAEYLLELVRRLNLLLSIMKGTANLKEMESPILSQTESVHGLSSLPSGAMAFSEPSFTDFVCGLKAPIAGQISYLGKAKTIQKSNGVAIPVKRLYGKSKALTLHTGKQAAPLALNLKDHTHLITSLYQAAMEIFNCFYLSSGHGLAKTMTHTALLAPQPYLLQVQSNAAVIVSAEVSPIEPQKMESMVSPETITEVTVVSPWVVRTQGSVLAKAKYSTAFDRLRPRRFSSKFLSGTPYVATLESAWYAPIWVDGKLYIRQAYETVTNETTLEVI